MFDPSIAPYVLTEFMEDTFIFKVKLTTICPWQVTSNSIEGGPDIKDAISHNNIVINRYNQTEDNHAETDTFCDWSTSPNLEIKVINRF